VPTPKLEITDSADSVVIAALQRYTAPIVLAVPEVKDTMVVPAVIPVPEIS
jgi:hypothetical protein